MATGTVNAKLRPPLRREADLYYARLAANAQRGGGGGREERWTGASRARIVARASARALATH